MKQIRSTNSRILIHLVLTILWLTNLKDTESYFSIYALTAAASLFCLFQNGEKPFPCGRKALAGAVFFSLMLALTPVLSNYALFDMAREITALSDSTNHILGKLEQAVTFFCGILIFYEIIKYFVFRVCRENIPQAPEGKYPARVFLGTFCLILAIDLTYLFCVVYPGNLSHDTMAQLHQIEQHVFTNFTPFWHTQLIRMLMGLGYRIFGTANAAAALFCVMQIFLMASVFGYTVMTLYELRVPRYWLVISFLLYALMPYHIAFSASIWKDVPYGAALLLLITAMFRIMKKTGGHPVLDQVILTFAGILSCMARTNGVYVMAATFLILTLVLRKQIRQFLIPWVIAVALGGIMNGPVLTAMNIEHIRAVETLALPLQQAARVIAEDGKISEEDLALLDQVVDVEKIPEIFWDITVDPVKNAIMEKNPDYFFSHKQEYTSLWIRLGIDNPGIYLKAWVDLTKGYWNGGYDYYTYAEYIADNSYGLVTQVKEGPVWRLYKSCFALTRETILFEPLLSIGLMVWLTFLGFYLSLLKRKQETVLFIPLIIIVVCLWIGAPVYSEFRYVYPLFTAFPMLFPAVLYGKEKTDSVVEDMAEVK